MADEPLTCAECGRKPRDNENATDEWRAYRLPRAANPLKGAKRSLLTEGQGVPLGIESAAASVNDFKLT